MMWSSAQWVKRTLEASSRVLAPLSCYLSIILKHSDTKRDFKNKHSRSNFRGAPVVPRRHPLVHVFSSARTLVLQSLFIAPSTYLT